MTIFRCSAGALALSLALAATGPSGAATPPPAATAATAPTATSTASSTTSSTTVNNPVGGQQLAAAGVIVNLPRGVPAPPAMPSASFLLADMDTGQILVAKAPHARHLPASTLKTLTALTLIPLMNPKSRIVAKEQDVAPIDGTHVGIIPGVSYSVATLFQGLLMASGNDAAYALARGNHSVATTLQQMNATAADLGAFDTVARDPSGLDKNDQRSSAYDLALIGRAAMRLPDFRRYVGTKWITFPGGRDAKGKVKPSFAVGNHNKLLHNYPGTIGIKNGYTVAAKYTYIEAATRGGKTYLLTEMASPAASWRPSAAMLSWAFAHATSLTPIGELVEPGQEVVSKPTIPPTARPQAVTTTSHAQPHEPELPEWVGATLLMASLVLVVGWARLGWVRRRIRKTSRTG